MQVFLILFYVYFAVFQPLKLFSYIELTLINAKFLTWQKWQKWQK